MLRSAIHIITRIFVCATIHSTALCQWEGYVTCHETWIDLRPADGWNGVVPRCMDTLRIGVTAAMRRHTSSADPVCAKLFRLGALGSPIQRQEIPAKISCEGPLQVTIIPAYRLPATDERDIPIRYEIQMFCTYWHGPDEHDTSRIEFRKATGFQAYARAVDVETGLDITSLGLVTPTSLERDHSVFDGMQLIAFSKDGYEFERWSCSDAGLLPDSLALRQLLDSLCWPVLRAVEYIGHFRRISTQNVERRSDCSISVQRSGSAISITNTCVESGVAKIFDITGQLVATFSMDVSHKTIPTDSFSVGPYVIVVYAQRGTTTLPFIVTKE